MKFIFLLLFLVVSILNVVFSKKEDKIGIRYTKSVLMPLLIIFYLLSSSKPNYLIAAALGLRFLGDIFLMRQDRENLLLKGLGAFFAGHIFYIAAFWGSSILIKSTPSWIYFCTLPYIATGLLYLDLLFPSIKSMKVPSLLYMIVVFLMSYMSLTRLTAVPFLSFLPAFLGSILFIVSDTMLLYELLSDCKKKDEHYIMSTYILAQFLIVAGFLAA